MKLEALNQFSVVKQGDTKSEFKFKLLDFNDIAVDLTGQTVIVKIANSIALILEKEPDVDDDPTTGIISFSFSDEDVTGYGDMRLEVHVTDGAGDTHIIPSSGYYKFTIDKNLNDASAGVTNYTLQYFTGTYNDKMTQFDSKIGELEGAIGRATASATTANTAAENANTKIAELTSTVDTKSTELEQRIDTAIAAGTQDLEVKDARGEFINLKQRLDATDLRLTKSARQTQVLSHGTQVIDADQNSPVDIEIQGRTLVSLGNSLLLNGKKYVIADKKTKVKVDNNYIQGVAKFTKQTLLTSTANFVGKVSGSTVENPHIFKYDLSDTLINPSDGVEQSQGSQYNVSTLNDVKVLDVTSENGLMAQHLFSFNIIEEIERKLRGRIPANDTAGKVQWLKDNVNNVRADWYGYGSSPTGNKAIVQRWSPRDNTYYGAMSHSSGAVSKISNPITSSIDAYVDSNGFVHFLAYAEPSDGVTASTINTDYVECLVELKSTAQLDTRPQVLRVANFEGKQSGSTVENPHLAKWAKRTVLEAPSGAGVDFSQTEFNNMYSLNGVNALQASTVSGEMSQHRFSFDLIAEIERNIGRIPRSTVADKVQWLNGNVSRLSYKWYGFGTSVDGSKATINAFTTSQSWSNFPSSTTSSTVVKLNFNLYSPNITEYIQSDGFIHFIAYSEPSDGVTASTINTDYVELEIELKPDVDFHDPLIPLYEVTDEEYSNILTTWDESAVLTRYPMVQGVQSLTNPYVVAEGENLLPPFNEWTLHPNIKIKEPYSIEINKTGTNQLANIIINVLPNTTYTLSVMGNSNCVVGLYYPDNTVISAYSSALTKTFITKATATQIKVSLAGNNNEITVFDKPILTLGDKERPFTPRNPSYLFTSVKLGQIGTVKDTLYKQDGKWMLRKVIEKDVELDTNFTWNYVATGTGFKRIKSPNLKTSQPYTRILILTKYDSSSLRWNGLMNEPDVAGFHEATLDIQLTIKNDDSGWSESYTPTADEIKAYLNGWKVKTADGSNKPTAWVSVIDGSAPTENTIAYVMANKAPNYTPYKLSYILAAPQIIDVTDKVEGDIAVSGQTQVDVDSGVIVREKANPTYFDTYKVYVINNKSFSAGWLNNSVNKILSVYKNGVIDNKWKRISSAGAVGKEYLELPEADFDPTAEYTVTYLPLDRHLLTSNATDVKATYANNIRSALDDVVVKQNDLATNVSVNTKALIDLYVRVKALEGGA